MGVCVGFTHFTNLMISEYSLMVKSLDSRARQLGSNSTLVLSSCVPLGKLLNLTLSLYLSLYGRRIAVSLLEGCYEN